MPGALGEWSYGRETATQLQLGEGCEMWEECPSWHQSGRSTRCSGRTTAAPYSPGPCSLAGTVRSRAPPCGHGGDCGAVVDEAQRRCGPWILLQERHGWCCSLWGGTTVVWEGCESCRLRGSAIQSCAGALMGELQHVGSPCGTGLQRTASCGREPLRIEAEQPWKCDRAEALWPDHKCVPL